MTDDTMNVQALLGKSADADSCARWLDSPRSGRCRSKRSSQADRARRAQPCHFTSGNITEGQRGPERQPTGGIGSPRDRISISVAAVGLRFACSMPASCEYSARLQRTMTILLPARANRFGERAEGSSQSTAFEPLVRWSERLKRRGLRLTASLYPKDCYCQGRTFACHMRTS